MKAVAIAAFLAALGFPSYAQTQATPPDKKDEPKKEAAPQKDPKVEEYEKAVKDLKRVEGPFTFYLRKKDILLELPESDLGRIFLIQATFQTGSSTSMTQAGDPVGPFESQPFRWERKEESVWIVRPNLRYRWKPDDPYALAASRSFPEAVLGSFPIVASHPEKKLLLINLTNLFYGDYLRLTEIINAGVGGQYMMDREKSGPGKVKGFPDNSVVKMDLYYFTPRGGDPNPILAQLGLASPSHLEDDRSLPISLSYNLWYRPASDYRPRSADPRIGYFTQDFYSLDKFLGEDRTERFINRWNLKKSDPSAEVSTPFKPIVWTLDPSIPKEYRQACREGILRWNLAFEKIGFKDAIVVRDAPDNDPEWDHADARFNVLRWTMSPNAGYAIALARTDPFTGEILNASVTFDANMIQFAGWEYGWLGLPSAEAHTRGLSVMTRNQAGRSTAEPILFASPDTVGLNRAYEETRRLGWAPDPCRYASGLRESVATAWSVLEAAPTGIRISKDRYVKQFITDVVSHEIGHTLGLRHNFISSTHLSTKQLADDSITRRESIAASVMEYTPVNILAILKGTGDFYAPTLGRYDYWAVEYGYTPVDPKLATGERPVLAKIASRSDQPGLAYMTDENADTWNPYVVRFDCARDPIAYSAKMLEAHRRVRDYAITKLPHKGESYAQRTSLITRSIGGIFREGRYTARFVGGLEATRSHYSGKAKATLRPVSARDQREAVDLVAKACLEQSSFDLPTDVLLSLSRDPDAMDSPNWTAPLRDVIGAQQTLLLSMLMSASITDRITENEYKAGKGAYTVDEHYARLMGAVFREIRDADNVSPLRRDLQRFAVSGLITQAGAAQGAVSDDVRVAAVYHLRSLSGDMKRVLAKSKEIDRTTVLHVRDAKESIDRFLARSVAVAR